MEKFFFPFLSWSSARHYFGIWVSFICQIMFLVFQWTKGNSFDMATNLSPSFEKLPRGRRSASPLTHIWLIGSEILPCPYHLVIIERVKERRPLPPPPFCNSCLLLLSADGQKVALASPKCIRVSYFLVTIHIYAHWVSIPVITNSQGGIYLWA